MHRTGLLLAFAPFLVVLETQAQSTVGELLESGGRLLDAAAFKAAFVGREFTGLGPTGADIEASFRVDGQYTGTSYNMLGGLPTTRGKVMAFFGPWRMDDSGRVCFTLQWSPGTGRSEGCVVGYELKGQHYVAANQEPETRVFLRKMR